ncbi:MAG: hypothetical protein KKF44_10660 [Nanoarchaeota archaeon]|nr:hypothetical protein [Nanoarchaeota archaeon]
MAETKKDSKKKDDTSGLFIPAGIFIGMGVGFIIGQLVGGLFLGMGLGFLAMAVSKNSKK